MPVLVKSMNGIAAMQKLGVEQHLLDNLVDLNVEVKLTASQFVFSYADTKMSVEVTLDTLQKLNAGKLGLVETQTLKHKLNVTSVDMVHETLKLLQDGKQPSPTVQTLPPVAPIAIDKAVETPKPVEQKPAGFNIPAGAQLSTTWPLFDVTKIETATRVHLRDANKMYQPVRGTSGNSRYFLVGGNADIRIAARFNGGSLGVRIEGLGLSKHLTQLSSFGMKVQASSEGNQYASIHLTVGDGVTASKTLGAILVGLGIQLETPMPLMQLIAGKGA